MLISLCSYHSRAQQVELDEDDLREAVHRQDDLHRVHILREASDFLVRVRKYKVVKTPPTSYLLKAS